MDPGGSLELPVYNRTPVDVGIVTDLCVYLIFCLVSVHLKIESDGYKWILHLLM